MWNGEYCCSADCASIVIGPGSGTRRMLFSDVRMIFTGRSLVAGRGRKEHAALAVGGWPLAANHRT